MKYRIIAAEYPNELEEQINKHILHGWKPQGGLVVTKQLRGGNYYRQAMIKE